RWIGLASIADVAIVWARTDEGVRGFVVPTTTIGYRPLDIVNKMSMRASIQCDLYFDDLRLPGDAMLPGAEGLAAAFSCLDEARYGIVWGALGAARACLDAAVTRATTREVFGAPIASRQLVQHSLAESFVEYEKGMLLALHLGRLKEAGPVPPEQISAGKLNSVREAIAIAHAARGILGGDGVTTDFPVMRHLANLESVRTYEGTDEIHTLVIGRALTGIDAFRLLLRPILAGAPPPAPVADGDETHRLVHLKHGAVLLRIERRHRGMPGERLLQVAQVGELQQHPEPVAAVLLQHEGVVLGDRSLDLGRNGEFG